VIYKLLLGLGEVGIAVGFEKMRDSEGKMDGKLIGQALACSRTPMSARARLHLRTSSRGDGRLHEDARRDRARPRVRLEHRVRQREQQPVRADEEDQVTLDDCANIGDRNKYIIEGLPLKTYDCSQITDGYAAVIVATEEGLKRLGVAKADACRSRATRRPPTACCARTATC